jgi:hypothetical protein
MTDELILGKMRTALDVRSDSNDLINCIIALKAENISLDDIYRLLVVLRKDFADGRDEVKEEAILGTMDYMYRDMGF